MTLLELIAVAPVSYVLGLVTCKLLTSKIWLDRPNHRSSHVIPVPKVGGLVLIVGLLSFLVMYSIGIRKDLLIPSFVLALVGVVDDLHPLSAKIRLCIQLLLSSLLIWHTGVASPVDTGQILVASLVFLLSLLSMTWFINLFNFMDGINGIALSQAIFMFLVLAVVGLPVMPDVALLSALLALLLIGVMPLNFPSAKLFLGDAGSLMIGFLIAGICYLYWVEGILSLFSIILLGALFLVDATATLLWRWRRKENITEAHANHFYQRVARRLGSHTPITILYSAINVFWLLPMFYLSLTNSYSELLITLIALLPICIGYALERKVHGTVKQG